MSRLVRGKLPKGDMDRAAKLNDMFGINDVHFVEDLIALFRSGGKGLPSTGEFLKKRLTSYRKKDADPISHAMHRRYGIFLTVVETLQKDGRPARDPVKCAEHMLIALRDGNRARNLGFMVCRMCPLAPGCAFGGQYANRGGTWTVDFTLPTHKDCPHGLNGLSPHEIVTAMQSARAQMVQSDPLSQDDPDNGLFSHGQGMREAHPITFMDCLLPRSQSRGPSESTFSGAYLPDDVLDVANTLKDRKLVIFMLARKFLSKMDSGGKARDDESKTPKRESYRTNRTVGESAKALPAEQLKDDLLFTTRAATKQLLVRKHEDKKKDGTSVFHILFDSSPSMHGWVRDSLGMLASRAEIGAALAIATLMRMMRKKSYAMFRSFAGTPGPLHSAEGNEILTLIKLISLCDFSGGSTEIGRALDAARGDIEDVRAQSDALNQKIKDIEILLISDTEDDSVYMEAKTREALKRGIIRLNTVHIDFRRSENTILRNLSSTYVRTDFTEKSLDKVLKVTKEITDDDD